jgi:hypothetical protein
MKTDPAFQRTRENGAEFSRAGTASKVLRNALRSFLKDTKDSRMSVRLTKEMMRVIHADTTNARGSRTPMAGDITILNKFEFNENGKLASAFHVLYSGTINRVTGELSIQISEFVPANEIAGPEGASHCQLLMAAVEVDFNSGNYTLDTAESAVIALDQQPQAAQVLSAAVTPQSLNPLFLVFGVRFSQFVNGAQYPLRNGAFNALAIVDVNRV